MTLETIYECFLKCDRVCTDTRNITQNCMFFALKGGNFNGNKFANAALKNGASYAVIDDEDFQESEQYILVEDVLTSLQQLATIHRKSLNIPIISLTGSNGKTTTKELIYTVLSKKFNTSATKGNLNNHIGVPLTLLSMTASTEIGIVEMGANHQKEIEFLCSIALPDYGLITNFGKAHLEGFGNFDGVIKGKSELYEHLKLHDKTIFVNEDDPLQLKQAGEYGNTVQFGSETKMLHSKPYVNLTYKQHQIQTQLTGAYNFDNIRIAIAIGEYFKVIDNDIVEAIQSYKPSNNRSQIINKNGHLIILDAYNANPTSMMAALSNFNEQDHSNKVAILGDMFELGEDAKNEHQAISDLANDLDLKQVFLIGENFYATATQHEAITYFKSFEDLKNKFDSFKFRNTSFLIKGSRGMALERVIDLL